MSVTRKEVRHLAEILTEHFDYTALAKVLLGIDRDLEDIIGKKAGMEEVGVTVAKVAGKQHWFPELVEAIRQTHAAGVPEFEALYKVVTAPAVSPAPGQPFEAVILRSNRPFVDRHEVREYLRRLTQSNQDRVLVVSGDRWTGKSYTADLVYYERESLANGGARAFEVLWVDISEDEDTPREELVPVSALDLAESIAEQLGLELSEKLETTFVIERPPRWARRFCNWLKGQLRDREDICWLMIDGFESGVLEEGTEHLIEELADRVSRDLESFRLILLGYEGPLSHVRGRLYTDTISVDGPFIESELTALFALVHHSVAPGDSDEELSDRAAETTARILRGIDRDHPKCLKQLGDVLTEEIARVMA